MSSCLNSAEEAARPRGQPIQEVVPQFVVNAVVDGSSSPANDRFEMPPHSLFSTQRFTPVLARRTETHSAFRCAGSSAVCWCFRD